MAKSYFTVKSAIFEALIFPGKEYELYGENDLKQASDFFDGLINATIE